MFITYTLISSKVGGVARIFISYRLNEGVRPVYLYK